MHEREPNRVPPAAWILGYAGAIPFVACAVAVWAFDGASRGFAMIALIAYGAAILSFLGGIRWGLAIANGRDEPGLLALTVSVVPALVAWLALLAPAPATALAALVTGLVLIAVSDAAAARDGRAPAWYPRLRWPLAAIATTALGAALVRVLS